MLHVVVVPVCGRASHLRRAVIITPTDHGAVVQVQPAFPPKFELEAAWNSGCRDGGGGRVSV